MPLYPDGTLLDLAVRRMEGGTRLAGGRARWASARGWSRAHVERAERVAEERGLAPTKKGVIVLDVAANSEARRAGFRSGDIVLQINTSAVERVQDVLRLARNASGDTALEIERGNRRLRVTLRR